MKSAHSPLFIPPQGYLRIKTVKSFNELVTTPLDDGVNALCWLRTLSGDFCEVVDQLAVSEGITTLDESRLNNLALSAAGRQAVEVLLEDQRLLRAVGLAPVLDCIQAYPRDEKAGAIIPTDVYSFHADSAPVQTDTYLCSYNEVASEGLRNDEAQRRVDIPETRAELLKTFGGEEGDEFCEFLNENCYDLHYVPTLGARPFSFGLSHVWRIAVDYPDSPVPPCIHRAPETFPGQAPRLLLIS